jgi:hypothetical protein
MGWGVAAGCVVVVVVDGAATVEAGTGRKIVCRGAGWRTGGGAATDTAPAVASADRASAVPIEIMSPAAAPMLSAATVMRDPAAR